MEAGAKVKNAGKMPALRGDGISGFAAGSDVGDDAGEARGGFVEEAGCCCEVGACAVIGLHIQDASDGGGGVSEMHADEIDIIAQLCREPTHVVNDGMPIVGKKFHRGRRRGAFIVHNIPPPGNLQQQRLKHHAHANQLLVLFVRRFFLQDS